MARPVRIHIPNAFYLLQIRVLPEMKLFTSEAERDLFIRSMEEACEAYKVKVHAFALLETSALLLVRSGQFPLSQFVHRCQSGYLNRMKADVKRELPRIRDRHRSILIEDGPLFPRVLARVHLAPVIGGHWSNESEARKLGEILRTRWTSLPIYNGQLPEPAWFDTGEAVRRLSHLQPGRPDEAPSWFIMREAKQLGEEPDVLDEVRAMSLLGSKEFVDRHLDLVRGRKGSRTNTSKGADRIKSRFTRLKNLVAKHYDVRGNDLLVSRSRLEGRKVLVELAMRHAVGSGGVSELAERLNISGSALAHLRRSIRNRMRKDPSFAELVSKLERQFLSKHS